MLAYIGRSTTKAHASSGWATITALASKRAGATKLYTEAGADAPADTPTDAENDAENDTSLVARAATTDAVASSIECSTVALLDGTTRN